MPEGEQHIPRSASEGAAASANREVAIVGQMGVAETHVANLTNIASFVQREDPQFADELCAAASFIQRHDAECFASSTSVRCIGQICPCCGISFFKPLTSSSLKCPTCAQGLRRESDAEQNQVERDGALGADEVIIAQMPCGCRLTDKGRDLRCREHAIPKPLSDRQRALKVWGSWATGGWDRPDDDLANDFSFTPEECRAAITAYSRATNGYLSDEDFSRHVNG